MATGFAPSRCLKCNEAVGHGPVCSVCGSKFHFGCSGVSERGFERLGTNKKNWLCASCRDNATSITSEPAQSHNMEVDCVPGNSEVLQLILAKISNLEVKFSSFQSLQSDLKQVAKDISDLKSSFESKMEEITTKVSNIEDRVSSLESTKSVISNLKVIVNELVEKNAHNEQWVRRSNLQINGVPQKAGENLIDLLKTLAKVSGFPFDVKSDLDFVTRVAVMNNADNKKPKPIIVKMQSRYKKDDFLASIRKLKEIKTSDLGFSGDTGRIYVNDHLSSRNKILLQKAKQRAKEKEYKYCWVRNCTIMVRRNDSSPVLHITSEDALKKIS